ncbi:unnamed protein product [Medioppia subpectinata]|uniref:G-protein coupled receptors family 1 profile domain-containing protein n=1 Tax=Medioppia subpectinata TaxID=1979941 RepID=A0A7R9Q163_9ACAR|nr:unnamed protein product [Medioppia subpectinata]CAG2108743.1 unnamed protein product [Medioppia subpectinata]
MYKSKVLCVLKLKKYDAKLYDVLYISLCFVIPLIIITVLYLRICHHLWTSPLPGCTLQANRMATDTDSNSCCLGGGGSGVADGGTYKPKQMSVSQATPAKSPATRCVSETAIKLIIERRKKVIKLLITIVLVFAVLSTPFHLRKLVQHFSPDYDVSTDMATIFTIFSTLCLYSNSAVNPLIYLIFSKKLRRLMIDVFYRMARKLDSCNRYDKHGQYRLPGGSNNVSSITPGSNSNEQANFQIVKNNKCHLILGNKESVILIANETSV